MGRAPCCDKANVKKGPWSPEEDAKLKEFIENFGTGGNWIALPQKAGLKRCGKSCRLRWLNYLRPNIKHGEFSDDEDRIICNLFNSIGSRWSIIAAQLPGRTDNDIKNYWNTKLKKKLMGIVPSSQMMKPVPPSFPSVSQPVSTPLAYKCSSTTTTTTASLYYLPTKSPPGFEPISSSSIPSITNQLSNNTSIIPSLPHQSQESCLVGPMHHYQRKDTTLPMYGGEQSCSSSDGSCNQISYCKDIDQHEDHLGSAARNEPNYGQHLGLQSYSCNGYEENQKIMLGFGLQKPIGLWGETPLEYDLEEIKQLISTNGCSNYIDETKSTLGRIRYY